MADAQTLALALMRQTLFGLWSLLCGPLLVGLGDIALADHLCLPPPLQLRGPSTGERQTSRTGIFRDGSCPATLHCVQLVLFWKQSFLLLTSSGSTGRSHSSLHSCLGLPPGQLPPSSYFQIFFHERGGLRLCVLYTPGKPPSLGLSCVG